MGSLLVTVLRLFGVVIALGGLGTLVFIVPTLPDTVLQLLIGFIALLVTVFGVVWYFRVTASARRHGVIRSVKLASLLAPILAVPVLTLLYAYIPIPILQSDVGCSTDCIEFKNRVVTIEYFIVSITLIAGLMAFGPILFGRTIIGPIFQDLQYLSGGMLLLLIVLLLFIFPLHVMYVDCTSYDPNLGTYVLEGCTIDMCELVNRGPPLTRFVISMILPPNTVC